MQRETPWAAVRFLQAAIKRHSRRLRIQEWLLLAIRTAIIVLVVTAAAKPLLDQLGGLLGGGVRTHRVLVIDASMSMQYQSEDGSLLAKAKRVATELVDQSSPGDQFSLCVLASPPSAPIATPTTETASVRNAISAIEATDGEADLLGMLTRVEGLLNDADKRSQQVERTEVIILSDLTRSTWQPVATGNRVAEGRAAEGGVAEAGGAEQNSLSLLAKRATVSLIDVAAGNLPNLAATRLQITSGRATLKQSVRLRGTIRSFGGSANEAASEQVVELLVDGLPVASQTVSPTAGEPTTVEFDYRFDRPGWRRVALRLPADQLAIDDRRLLGVEVKPYIAVLCIEGRRGAARYVAQALNPGKDADAPLQPEVISDADLATTELTPFDAVILCNVSEFTTREATRLDRYVRAGGGVTFFLGDRVRPDRYNELFSGEGFTKQARGATSPYRFASYQQPASPTRLMPVLLGEPVSQTAYGVDPLEYQHPIVAPFRGRERAGLLTTPIERYFKMRTAPAAKLAEVVMATSGGDPLMVASPVGKGRVVVVATAGSLASVDQATGRPWTAMPAWPSFVPIVRELVRYTSGASAEASPRLVGQPITAARGHAFNMGVKVVRPDETVADAEQPAGADSWEYVRTDRAGFYTMKLPGDEQPIQVSEVNSPPAESDTSRLRPADLPPAIAIRQADWQASAAAPELIRPVGIHRHLILAAIALALLETWLACQFGRGAA